jgi:hypothetical protein
MFGEPCYFSFASETYATLSHRALVALITHLESKYGSRIVGYSPGNGVYGEWFSWSAYWEVPSGTPPPENFGMEDYCAPAQSTFKQWLKGKYRGKLEELQRAWGDPKVTFDTASVPSEEIRKHPTYGIFFNPAISSQVPDYFEFFNNMIANVLLEVRVTTEQRAAIHPRFKRNHATPVWVYAPGYINRKLSVENMLALTGIRLAESHSPGELRVEVTSRDHPYTKSLPADFAYGTDVNVDSIKPWFDHGLYLKDPSDSTLRRDLPGFSISPRFWGDDAGAKVLGRLAGLDRPGLLVKEQSGWTSVYSSAPILPAALLRNIARAAGCHIYSDANDVVYANENFITVYSPTEGARTIRLPRAARVIDLMENKTLSTGKMEFELSMPANTAELLALE